MVTQVFLEGAHFQCTETLLGEWKWKYCILSTLEPESGIFQEIQFAKQTNGQPTFEYQVLESNGFQVKMVNIKQFLLDGWLPGKYTA